MIPFGIGRIRHVVKDLCSLARVRLTHIDRCHLPRSAYCLSQQAEGAAEKGCRSAVVEWAAGISEPQSDEVSPPIRVGPIFESCSSVAEPAVVQNLNLTGLKLEIAAVTTSSTTLLDPLDDI